LRRIAICLAESRYLTPNHTPAANTAWRIVAAVYILEAARITWGFALSRSRSARACASRTAATV